MTSENRELRGELDQVVAIAKGETPATPRMSPNGSLISESKRAPLLQLRDDVASLVQVC